MYHTTVMMLGRSGGAVGAGTVIFGGKKLLPKMRVLTAAHIVVSLEKQYGSATKTAFYFKLTDGRKLRWKVLSLVPETDLAVVETTEPTSCVWPHTEVEAKPDYLYRGSTLWIVSALAGIQWHFSRGIVSAGPAISYKIAPLAVVFYTDAAVYPGSSGGGVFSRNAKLIGVLSGCYIKQVIEPDMDVSAIPLPGAGVFVSLLSIQPLLEALPPL